MERLKKFSDYNFIDFSVGGVTPGTVFGKRLFRVQDYDVIQESGKIWS